MNRSTVASLALLVVGGVAILSSTVSARQRATTPQQASDELLAADRAFSSASAKTTVIEGLRPMFAPDVIMPLPTGAFAKGVAAVVDGLKAVPDNLTGRLEWTPIRVGLSGDGQQGFTFGFMTLHKADGTKAPLKYMTYWVKGVDGWRAVAYKRNRRAEGDVSLTLMPPALPSVLIPATTASDAARQELVAAEKAFSDEAQRIGLGPAFFKYGLPDAVNFGGPASASFVVGAEAISMNVGGGSTDPGSPVSWSCETPIVASSGDLGVSIGFIRPNTPSANGPANGIPFFTIWRKNDGVWRYVAE